MSFPMHLDSLLSAKVVKRRSSAGNGHVRVLKRASGAEKEWACCRRGVPQLCVAARYNAVC